MTTPRPCRLLTAVVASTLMFGVGPSAAQTLLIRNAPAGSMVDVQMDSQPARSAAADADGDATFALGVASAAAQSDVRFFVDVCAASVRVQIVSTGLQPPASAGACNRREMWGIYVMRPSTTFVVDFEGTVPSIHLTQGPPPASWLGRGPQSETTSKYFLGAPPVGLAVFAGAGIPLFSSTSSTTCGDLTTCTVNSFIGAGAVGGTIWIRRFLGAQVTLAKPGQVSANGGAGTYRFHSTLESRLATIAGTAGASVGAVRLYGLGGANYHRATFLTSETIQDATVVVNGVTQTIAGGTQVFEHRTEGWNWLVGGGVEAWATGSVAFYAEVQHARLKATDLGAAEGGIDDHVTVVVAGARVHVGR